MNIGRILKFLVSGIVIGAVLFFAGFGVINMMDKSSSDSPTTIETQSAPEVELINPPTIEITSTTPTAGTGEQLGTGSSPIKIKPLNNDDAEVSPETVEEQPIQTVEFGTLTLSTVNAINGAATNSDFLIENSENIAIAQVKDTASSTLSLPVGDYKITVSNAGQQVVRFLGVKANTNGAEVFEMDVAVLDGEAPLDETAVSENQTVEASEASLQANATPASVETNADDSITPNAEVANSESDLDTTANDAAAMDNQAARPIGGLRLSALTKQGKRPTIASFSVQRLSGELVETIENVKTQQLSLPAGQYKVTAKTATSSTVKEVEVLATRGIHEIFLIDGPAVQQSSAPDNSPRLNQQANQPPAVAPPTPQAQPESANTTPASANNGLQTGKLELFAQNASNNSPIKSNFYVQMPNGKMVASKVYVDSIGYKLAVGQYKVIVRATGFKDKSITLNVRPEQTRRETFKLEAVTQQPVRQPPTSNVNNPARQNASTAFGGLTVNVVSASNRSALPVDIVVIQRDGTPLKQAFKVASASFDLPPREFVIRVTHNGFVTNHPVSIVQGKLAIKTISIDTNRLSRQERRRIRRERQERSQ